MKNSNPDATTPDLGPEPGWTEIHPNTAIGATRNFVHGDDSGERFRIRFYREPGSDALLAKAWLGPAAEGPPGHAHGGAILAVLDEVLGGSAWAAGHKVVLARFESDVRNPVPLGRVVIVRAEPTAPEGRKVWVTGSMRGLDGTLYAEARCLFVTLRPEQREAYLAHARDGHTES